MHRLLLRRRLECLTDSFCGGTDCFEDLIEHTKAASDR